MKVFVQQRSPQLMNQLYRKHIGGLKMKKIISLVVLISSIVIAQSETTKTLIELKLNAAAIQNTSLEFQNSKQGMIVSTPTSQLPEAAAQKKSPALAIVYSLLLPGMGELYAGRYDSGKYFTIAEGVLWGAYTGFELYGNWQRDNYKAFAQSAGGVNLEGKNSDYFATITNYQNITDYNKAMDLQGGFSVEYNPTTYYWNWQNDSQRREYKSMWTSSEQTYNNVRFVVGAMILNRLISAINAVRFVSAYNKSLNQPVGSNQGEWNIIVGVDNKPTLPTTLTFNFIKSF